MSGKKENKTRFLVIYIFLKAQVRDQSQTHLLNVGLNNARNLFYKARKKYKFRKVTHSVLETETLEEAQKICNLVQLHGGTPYLFEANALPIN